MSRRETGEHRGIEKDWDLVYGRYNFQRPSTIEAVRARLDSSQASKVVVLSGPEGVGRRYVWLAALHHLGDVAGGSAGKWREIDIDLDGFEPDARSQEQYVSLLLERTSAGPAEESDARLIGDIASAMEKAPGPVGATAVGVGILLKLRTPLVAIARRLLGSADGRGRLPALPDRAWLGSLIEELAEAAPLAIFCAKPDGLTPGLRRCLMQAVEGNSRIALALAARERDTTESLWPRSMAPPLRVEMTPLSRAEAQAVFARRFPSGGYPATLADTLWSASGGNAGAMVARVNFLVERGVLSSDDRGLWVTGDVKIDRPEVLGIFKGDVLDAIEALRKHVDGEVWLDFTHFLGLGAACGDFVPASSILRFLQLDEERRERLIDLLDERLVCPRDRRQLPFRLAATDALCPIFDDIQFRHAGLPGELVYRFRDPIHRHALVKQRSFVNTAMAAAFFAGLEATLPTISRAAAGIHLSVVTALDDNERRQHALRVLRWWVGWNEADALEEDLIADLERQSVAPETIWAAIERFEAKWPPHRLLALLNAYQRQRGGPPADRLTRLHYYRSRQLSNLGKFPAALEECRLAARFVEAGNVDHNDRGVVFHQFGMCLGAIGKYDEAGPWFERAATEKAKGDIFGRVDHASVGTSLHGVGFCLGSTGKHDEARPWFERAATEKAKGDIFGRVDHASLGTSLREVGFCLSSTGKRDEARPWFERAATEKAKGDIFGRVDHDSTG